MEIKSHAHLGRGERELRVPALGNHGAIEVLVERMSYSKTTSFCDREAHGMFNRKET